MKKKEINELKNKSAEQLKKLVKEAETEIAKSKVQNEQSKSKNVHTQRAKRKDIARMMTFLNLKNLTEEPTKEAKNAAK